jgi:hypothetical protein
MKISKKKKQKKKKTKKKKSPQTIVKNALLIPPYG